ncbi:hypothetical protein ABH926_001021 [Catenulispora sp. GP43]|uniref:DUF4253 domain-containing protein n=1 Tax=Catenulispora sp. GP43 TaxID=3156263 RepID=UPI003511B368
MDLMGTATVKATLADGTDILAVTVEAGTARQAWRELREEHAMTGLWPFLVDAQAPTVLDRLPRAGEQREQHRGAAEIFARGKAVLPAAQTDPVSSETESASSVAQTTTIGLIAAEYGGVEIPGLLDWDAASGISGLEHTAVLADWRRRFGAELLALTADRIELHVPRPPTEAGSVAALRLEQAGYCAATQTRATGTLWCFQWPIGL